MAEPLDAWPTDIKSVRRYYPWTLWLDGRLWRLTPGVDFYPSHKNFRGAFYQECKRRGLKGQSAVAEDGRIYIKAINLKPSVTPVPGTGE